MRSFAPAACVVLALIWTIAADAATDIYDGIYYETVTPMGLTPLNIFGGTFHGGVHANGTSFINIFGGIFESSVSANGGNINISGGEFLDHLTANGDDAAIVVTGGDFHKNVIANGGSIYVGGGNFLGRIADSTGSVTISGRDFAFDGVPASYGTITERQFFKRLTGVLASGEPINAFVGNNQGVLNLLPIPEPSSAWLLVLCVIGISTYRLR